MLDIKISDVWSSLIKVCALYSDDSQLRLPLEGGDDS